MSCTPICGLSEPSGPIENGTTYIVRPSMQPSKSSFSSARISAGSRQLLVGPASSSSLGADEGAVLDAGDVARVRAGEVGVRALGVGELLEGSGVDQLLAEAVVLLGASRRTSGRTRAGSARRSPRPSRSGSCSRRYVGHGRITHREVQLLLSNQLFGYLPRGIRGARRNVGRGPGGSELCRNRRRGDASRGVLPRASCGSSRAPAGPDFARPAHGSGRPRPIGA